MQGGYFESAQVRVHPTGAVTVYTGTSPHGQGHETSFAQIVADRRRRRPGGRRRDPRRHQHRARSARTRTARGRWPSAARRSRAPRRRCRTRRSGSSRTSSRRRRRTSSWPTAASSVARLARTRAMTLAEVAGEAYIPADLPEGMEAGLDEICFYDPTNFVWPFGAHACITEVDVETGRVDVVRYIAVDDCGPAINPLLIDGPDPRRHRARARPGALRAGGLRRRRPAHHRHVRRLRAPERRRRAELRDRPHGDARRRPTRSASRASARRRRSPARRPSSARCSTRCGRWA